MLLAYRLFLDPLAADKYWWIFLFPLALGIAVVYKACRLNPLERYWRHVLVMTTQIVVGMFALAVASYLFIVIYIRFIAERVM